MPKSIRETGDVESLGIILFKGRPSLCSVFFSYPLNKNAILRELEVSIICEQLWNYFEVEWGIKHRTVNSFSSHADVLREILNQPQSCQLTLRKKATSYWYWNMQGNTVIHESRPSKIIKIFRTQFCLSLWESCKYNILYFYFTGIFCWNFTYQTTPRRNLFEGQFWGRKDTKNKLE